MLQNFYPQKSEFEIRKLFGSGFAASIMELEPGVWHGPVLSGYGTHLVYVSALDKAALPEFEDVQGSVLEDWQAEEQEKFNKAYYESLKSRYEIVIESAPTSQGSAAKGDADIAEENGSDSEPAT